MTELDRVSTPSTPLERYTQRLRRERFVYFGIVTAVVVVIGVLATVAWSRGEVAHVTLTTVAKAPPSLDTAAPNQQPTRTWSTSDRPAIGAPQWGGTVVTFDEHTVRGVNARTGKQTWSYTRSDRTVCTAAQLNGITTAVYAVNGNCDELTGLRSTTGARAWTRTLDMDGMPIIGRPTFQTLTEGSYSSLVVIGSNVLYSLDPSSGYNRWTYYHSGCSINGAAVGSSGVLISQNCSSAYTCPDQLQFCARGPQLLLRPVYDGRDDKSKTNPDKIVWSRVGNSEQPVSADGLVSTFDPTSGALHHLDAKTGSQVGSTTLSPSPTSASAISVAAATDVELLWTAGKTYAVRSGVNGPLWAMASIGAPTLYPNSGDTVPQLATARITIPISTGAASIDGNTGRIAQAFTLSPAPGADSVVRPLGTGFLVAGRGTTVAFA